MKLKIVACATLIACQAIYPDTTPDAHAPIGVMGDHTHEKNEWMFSYRFMHMDMDGNLDGSSDRSPEEIVLNVKNRFSNLPMQPPTLRVVPTEMTMDMHMLGLMYAPNNRVTIMAMTNYVEKRMKHTTYQGGKGNNLLGTFVTQTKGFGDTSISALIRLGDKSESNWHFTFGASLPTGSIEEKDTILTPMNTRPSPRLPYPMQLGSGTFDLVTGLTYANGSGRLGWGSQWSSLIRLGENDEDYTLGNIHQISAWLSHRISDRVSLSSRLNYLDRDNVHGIDPKIVAPVQTADPSRQGAERLDLSLGVNFLFPNEHQRLAIELSKPISQKLTGPQLETAWQVTIGWQYSL